MRYKVLNPVNEVFGNDVPKYTQTFEPASEAEAQHVLFDVTDYTQNEYCILLCDYAGNKSYYRLKPSEETEFSIRLDPSEITVVLLSTINQVPFKVFDSEGYELNATEMNWTITGASSPATSLTMPERQTVVITSFEKSPQIILTVSDPSDPSISASAVINIVKPSVKLEMHEALIAAGDALELKAETVPSDTKLTWTSSDVSVAQVDENGLVTAICPGKADIAASASLLLRDKCSIRVLFRDVMDPETYYFDPVIWATDNQITEGTTTQLFSPAEICTRAEIVTFLWRAAGSPEPASEENPFDDVKEDTYYWKPVLWAIENDITTGTSPNRFSPGSKCTRAQAVTFLYRMEGSPEHADITNPFDDISAKKYYYDAVLWAVENGITTGVKPNLFKPESKCTRAQIVTFLYRNFMMK